MAQEYHFKYNGTVYDATDYADKHPGGLQVLDNMKAIKKDFTEYFRYVSHDPEPFTPIPPKKCSKASESSAKRNPQRKARST